MSEPEREAPALIALEAALDGHRLLPLDASGEPCGAPEQLSGAALPHRVAEFEAVRPRWAWDTAAVYPALLTAGVRVERAHDVRLARALLRRAGATASAYAAVAPDGWDEAGAAAPDGGSLFDLPTGGTAPPLVPELRRQLAAVADSGSRLRLLVAAESAGALAAAEMHATGVPWRRAEHDRILSALLGPRPATGTRPAGMERLLADIRTALDAPALNPESPQELIRALQAAGLPVRSTRATELQRLEHPVIAPLLEYKKLGRLLVANGWDWLDRWVADDRFRPDYVVGGVVTGRWATRGGGAMQLPKQIRAAVIADPGWRLVVADAAQLEPRVLAGLAHDLAMAEAGRGRDLYDGIVAGGGAPDRAAAKVGMLGALYGATSGRSGQLLPRLTERFPRALGLVEQAARTGERGGAVSTLLGRTAPVLERPGRGDDPAAAARAREWGRFTRNFVVQGTAAEWALCWMADLRLRLWALGTGAPPERPHLAYFLHDEVLVHAPAELAEQAAEAVRAAAVTAGRLLFGDFPVDFPLDVALVHSYAEA